MKRSTSYLAVSLLVVTIMACRKEAVQSEAAAPDTTSSPAAPASSPYDLQFIDTMSAHHAGAVEMAKIAQGKIEQHQLEELVAKIPGDQQKEIDQMKAWREQWYPGAPNAEPMQKPGMSSSMNMDMSHMRSMKAGHDYDLMFIDMMVPHHEEAVTMAREALGKAEHQEIKTLAQQIIDAQMKEIEGMKKWKEMLNPAPATVTYTCPMHPEVKSDRPGKCPKCGMTLVKEEKK